MFLSKKFVIIGKISCLSLNDLDVVSETIEKMGLLCSAGEFYWEQLWCSGTSVMRWMNRESFEARASSGYAERCICPSLMGPNLYHNVLWLIALSPHFGSEVSGIDFKCFNLYNRMLSLKHSFLFFSFFFFFFCLFAISWDSPVAYGGSQARGLIRAVAASLHQSHSSTESEQSLQPTPQLMAMPDR